MVYKICVFDMERKTPSAYLRVPVQSGHTHSQLADPGQRDTVESAVVRCGTVFCTFVVFPNVRCVSCCVDFHHFHEQ